MALVTRELKKPLNYVRYDNPDAISHHSFVYNYVHRFNFTSPLIVHIKIRKIILLKEKKIYITEVK